MSTIEEAREQVRKALARYESQSANSPFHFGRDDHMYIALRALLDATEPPEIQYADSATVAALAEKIAGENAELMDRLAAKPAEDEREALVNVIRLFFQNWRAIGRVSPSLEVSIDSLEGAVDDLIELDAPKDGDYHEGFEEGVKVGRAGSGPRPITDEMVEAARRAWHDADDSTGPGTRMRAALEAAEEARR